MKYCYTLSSLLLCIVFSNSKVSGQLVTDNAFLQGRYLEVAMAPNGAWGNTVTAPSGYHIHPGASGYFDYSDPVLGSEATNSMDFNFDYRHDGWTGAWVGITVPWYGPYYMPGTPYDGWAIQINGIMSAAWYTDGGYNNSLGGTLAGTVTGYSNTGGVISGTWTGSAGVGSALQITETNTVDTNASWDVVTVKFKNTGGTAMPGVYYFVSADPDNDETDTLGSFPTDNHISYQGDYYNRHEVNAIPPTYRRPICFSGLATKDCRAQAMIYQSWPPATTAGNDLDLVWGGTATSMGTCYYTVGTTTTSQDIAYGMIYNLGTIGAGDSAILSFAWIFTDTTAIDSAFPEPQLVTLGVPHDSLDTVVGCDVIGNTFTASVVNGSDRNWSWSTWTWAPATGLSATTGVSVTINLIGLSGPTVYTITGVDTTAGTMLSCNAKTMYLYVTPCFHATNNGPICMNDTLFLVAHGDSTGCTYFWYGPGGFTAFTQDAFRTGLTPADAGTYYVVKTLGTEHDTVSTTVTLIPIPVATVTSNGPICSGNTLALSAVPDSIGETFTWTGPNGFTSLSEFPTMTGVPTANSGLYKVVTHLGPCKDSGYITVVVDSTPALPTISNNSPLCSQRSPALQLNSGDATPSVVYNWIGPNAFTSTEQNPSINNVNVVIGGVYTVTVSIDYDGLVCPNSRSTVVTIDSTPVTPGISSNSPVCSGAALDLSATDTPGSTYSWVGPNGFISLSDTPVINPATTFASGVYSVTATVLFTVPSLKSCISDTGTYLAVVDSTPVIPTASSNSPGTPSICQGDTLRLFSSDTTSPVAFYWSGPDGYGATVANPAITNVQPAATGQYTVTVIYNGIGLCPSSSVITVSITPTPPLTVTSNSPVCSGTYDTLFLQATSAPTATYSWTGPYVFTSLAQNPFRDPVIMEYGGIYTVKAFLNGCVSLTVNDTVIVRKTPDAPMVNWLNYCLNHDAPALQAFGDSILWYTSSVANGIGTLTAPIPSTAAVGNTFYFATQTIMGCTSAIDSIQVSVFPNPVVTVSNDTILCPHDTAILTAVDHDNIAYYHWAPSLYLSDTSSAVTVAHAETDVVYTVVATNQYSCTDTATVRVNVLPAAVISLGSDVTLYPGQQYQITSQTNCTEFTWFPPTGLDNPSSSDPLASPTISTLYDVYAKTSWGCIATDSINLFVSDQSLLAMPNAFAPGSGPNGLFKVILKGEATLKDFTIFDRWGVKLFETNDINVGWNGEYNGVVQPQGVYIYSVDAVSSAGTEFVKSGNVTLLR